MPRAPKDPDVPSIPPPDLGTVEPPKDAEGLSNLINLGVARALKSASTAKEHVDAVKAATEWYKVRYAEEQDDDLGTALGQGRSNGHGA